MNGHQELTYAVDFRAGRQDRQKNKVSSSPLQASGDEGSSRSIPRIARLMALALRFEGLLRKETLRDYAELAHLGGVTRARITQIMKLLDFAPDIQEQLLFLPPVKGLTERNLRPIVNTIDWREQRRLFQRLDKHRRIDLPAGRTRAIDVMYPAGPGPEERTPTMHAFTIDSDNNIAVHATLKAARETGAGVFDTAENLAELVGPDNQRLVEIWNSLTGVVPVKKFASRAIAVRRIFAEVQKLAPPAAEAPMTKSAPRASVKKEPKAGTQGAKKAEAGPKAGSKKDIVLGLISRKDGASLEELTAALDWQKHSVRGFIATLGKTVSIESFKTGQGVRAYKTL